MAYDWTHGKSVRAVAAESEGKLPLTRAVKVIAEQAECTQREARAACEAVGPCEWHHSSKFYNCVDYYNVEQVLAHIRGEECIDPDEALDDESSSFVEQLEAERAALKKCHIEPRTSKRTGKTVYDMHTIQGVKTFQSMTEAELYRLSNAKQLQWEGL